MPATLRLDQRFEPGAYVRLGPRVFEVLRFDRPGSLTHTGELWVEDICSFERLALNTLETRRLVLVRTAPAVPPTADDIGA